MMAYRALEDAGLGFDLIRAGDVREGRLHDYAAVFVPGGWASNKLKSLGVQGAEEIKEFVRSGGAYVGFCGGAGLATMDGIGLVHIKRKPTKERVPSFSGRIRLDTAEHPIWDVISDTPIAADTARAVGRGLNSEYCLANSVSGRIFNAWWPSQFVVEDDGISVLATYAEAMGDAFSSDINVGDAEAGNLWSELERLYGINLDPKRLYGEPAVVEAVSGKGRVLLSLVHFDTPGDPNGAAVLKNIWRYIGGTARHDVFLAQGMGHEASSFDQDILARLESLVSDIIDFGIRNFLWYWRNPMLLLWRRGVRGLEYCTLYIMVKELAYLCRSVPCKLEPGISGRLRGIHEKVSMFKERAIRLLQLERMAMQKGHITYEQCDDPEVRVLREELFSRAKSYGGLFKEIMDDIDGLVFGLLSHRVVVSTVNGPHDSIV